MHISRHLCYFFEARHPSRPTAYPRVGVHIFFLLNIAASEVLPPNNHFLFYSRGAQNLVHLTGQKNVFDIENFFDEIRCLDISPKNSGYGYNISIYRILRYRMIWDIISRYIATYHAISHRITSKHQAYTNSTKTHYFVAVYSCFFGFVSALILGCPPSGLFCRPSVVHQLDNS